MGRFDYEKKGTRWGGPGGAKGQPLRKVRKNLCPHGDVASNCDKCIRAENAAANRQARNINRAKRVNKAKKNQKKSGWCSFVLLILFGALGTAGWGILELVNQII